MERQVCSAHATASGPPAEGLHLLAPARQASQGQGCHPWKEGGERWEGRCPTHLPPPAAPTGGIRGKRAPLLWLLVRVSLSESQAPSPQLRLLRGWQVPLLPGRVKLCRLFLPCCGVEAGGLSCPGSRRWGRPGDALIPPAFSFRGLFNSPPPFVVF